MCPCLNLHEGDLTYVTSYAASCVERFDPGVFVRIRSEPLPFRDTGRACRPSTELTPLRLVDRIDRRTDAPAVSARNADSVEQLLASALADARREHDAAGRSEEAWQRTEARIRSHYATLQQNLNIVHVNAHLILTRTRLIDLAGGRIRWDDVDDPQTDALADAAGISGPQRMNVNQTKTEMLVGGQHITLYPEPLKLAHYAPLGLQSVGTERLRLGLLPEWVFGSEQSLTVEPGTVAGTIELRGTSGSGGFVAELSAETPYRVQRFRLLDGDGGEADWRMTGYSADEAFRGVPRRVEFRAKQAGVVDYVVETAELQGPPQPANIEPPVFASPPEYRQTGKEAVARS
jgi:hypothetical protein